MKGVFSLIALLFVFIAFTMWSMYEDARKRIIEENFSTGLFAWIIDSSSDSLNTAVRTDTLVLIGGQETAIRYEKPLAQNFTVNFSLRLKELSPASSLAILFNAQNSKNIEQPNSLLMLQINNNRLNLTYAGDNIFTQENYHSKKWQQVELTHRNDTLRFLMNGQLQFQGVAPMVLKGQYFGINLQQSTMELTQLKFTSLRGVKP